MKRSLCLIASLCLSVSGLFAQPAAKPSAIPPELPVETLFSTANLSSLSFSPNGKYVLCVVPYEHRANLAVIDLEKGTKNLLTSFRDKQVQGPLWANDDRILFRVDDDGKESYSLYAVNRDGSNPGILASGYSKSGSLDEVNDRFYELLRRSKNDPKSMLVLARLTNVDTLDVAKMDLKTGKMRIVTPPPGDVDRYVLDHNDEVRFAIVSDSNHGTRVLYRDKNGQDWQQVAASAAEAEGWEPMAFDGDNRTVFVASNVGRKTNALYRYDTVTKQFGAEVIADDTYDVVPSYGKGLVPYYDASKKKIVGFSYEADRTRFVWLDDEMAAIHKKLEGSLSGLSHEITQISEDGQRIIFFSHGDRDPGVYYLYDKPKQKLSELAVVIPKIDPDQMAVVRPIAYKARDGLLLHGYLTLPVGREPKNLPLVLHPHGGPYGPRDNWTFDPEVQFYANRGYAVLQVNFRGSGGYGAWFEAAGFKKWGLEMQDDLTDGVKWVIAQGIADPSRIVISGASYGGYATLAGLVYTPDLYCAGINYVGVADIETQIPKGVSANRLYWYNTRIGDLGKSDDRKRIHDTSPVHFADRIRVPLFMAYGKNDPRVPISQAYDIQGAMKSAGRPFELMIESNEGHGFRKEENRIAFYKRVDGFMKKYVPTGGSVKIGATEVVPDAAKK